MFQLLIFLIALNWFLRDIDPKIIKGLVKYGAIVFVVILAISTGSPICLAALAVAAGVVGLNFFKKHSSTYR